MNVWHREFRYYPSGRRWKMIIRCDCGGHHGFIDLSKKTGAVYIKHAKGHGEWSGKDIAYVIQPLEERWLM